jgi:putative cardiolipin synthase
MSFSALAVRDAVLHVGDAKQTPISRLSGGGALRGAAGWSRCICCAALLCGLAILAGCASYPPGRDYPRNPAEAVQLPPDNTLTAPFADALRSHASESGFRILPAGVDGLLLRLELIERAQRSLDLQYYIFRSDESGLLVSNALVRAARRGVRVRILVDDGETVAGDERLLQLAGQANIAIRVFNPWRYRGHSMVLRGVEFLFSHGRLDYRMHNKLFIADAAVAVFGGRNIGDQYFQVDPDSQFADDDVFTIGAAVGALAEVFQRFWSCDVAIPAQGLSHWHGLTATAPAPNGQHIVPEKAESAGANFDAKLQAGQPLADIVAGQSPLAWAHAEIASDSPDKKDIQEGARISSLVYGPVANAIRQTQSELTMITPYLVPTADELRLLQQRVEQQRRVRILTNSLEASTGLPAQAGYMHHRVALLNAGVQLFEVRARLDSVRGSGQSRKMSRYGNYGLHAKLMVFDRSSVYIGSMNFDERSERLNTEIGLIIQSPELAQQSAKRFEDMTQPQSAYAVTLQQAGDARKPRLNWTTLESGQTVTYQIEPARSVWQRMAAHLLGLMRLDREL